MTESGPGGGKSMFERLMHDKAGRSAAEVSEELRQARAHAEAHHEEHHEDHGAGHGHEDDHGGHGDHGEDEHHEEPVVHKKKSKKKGLSTTQSNVLLAASMAATVGYGAYDRWYSPEAKERAEKEWQEKIDRSVVDSKAYRKGLESGAPHEPAAVFYASPHDREHLRVTESPIVVRTATKAATRTATSAAKKSLVESPLIEAVVEAKKIESIADSGVGLAESRKERSLDAGVAEASSEELGPVARAVAPIAKTGVILDAIKNTDIAAEKKKIILTQRQKIVQIFQMVKNDSGHYGLADLDAVTKAVLALERAILRHRSSFDIPDGGESPVGKYKKDIEDMKTTLRELESTIRSRPRSPKESAIPALVPDASVSVRPD